VVSENIKAIRRMAITVDSPLRRDWIATDALLPAGTTLALADQVDAATGMCTRVIAGSIAVREDIVPSWGAEYKHLYAFSIPRLQAGKYFVCLGDSAVFKSTGFTIDVVGWASASAPNYDGTIVASAAGAPLEITLKSAASLLGKPIGFTAGACDTGKPEFLSAPVAAKGDAFVAVWEEPKPGFYRVCVSATPDAADGWSEQGGLTVHIHDA
jgi:hypothetical protein